MNIDKVIYIADIIIVAVLSILSICFHGTSIGDISAIILAVFIIVEYLAAMAIIGITLFGDDSVTH